MLGLSRNLAAQRRLETAIGTTFESFRMFVALASAFALLLGLLLGSVSPFNEYLHWNLWVFLPVSGMLFGAALAFSQSLAAQKFRLRIPSRTAALLSTSTVLAYFSTDIGLYLTSTASVGEVPGLPDGDYRIWQLISFVEYMQVRLGASSIRTLQLGIFELGSAGTALSYSLDLAAVGLSSWITFQNLSFSSPYCESCARHMDVTRGMETCFPPGTDLAEVQCKLLELGVDGGCDAVLTFLGSFAELDDPEACRAKVSLGRASCPMCSAQAVSGKFFRIERFDWLEVSELEFSIQGQGRAGAA
jgi:hypothetical protein